MKKLLTILFLIPLIAEGQRTMVAGWNENKLRVLPSTTYFLPTMIRLPSDYFDPASATKRYPVIFFGHGTGMAGTDTVKVLGEGWARNLSNNGSTSYTHEGTAKTLGSDSPTANDFNGNSREAIIIALQASSYGLNPAWFPYMFQDATGRLGLRVDSSMVGLYGYSAGNWIASGVIANNSDTTYNRFISAIIANSGATQDLTWTGVKNIGLRRIPTLFVVGATDISYRDQMRRERDTINLYSSPDVALYEEVAGQGHSGFDNNAANSKIWTVTGGKNFIQWFMLQHNNYATTWTPPTGGSTPVANAGGDQNIWLPKTTTNLSGSASTGTITSITWTKLSSVPAAKPQDAKLVTTNTLNAQVANLPLGIHTFRLTVTDGTTTSTDDVAIRVYPFRSKTPNPTHRKINLTKSGNDYYYSNIHASLGQLNGSDTLNFTQSANLAQLYGDDGTGGWGGDSVNQLVVTADPGVTIKQLRTNGQYLKYYNITFDNTGASSPILVATTKSRKVEISNCIFKGGDNAMYIKSRLDTMDVLSQHPNWDLEGFYIHDNLMTDQNGEAIYFNTTFSDEDTLGTSDFGDYPPVNASNVIFTRNTIKRAGWDGAQFSKAPNYTITHNSIDSTGLECKSAQLNGIIGGGYSWGRIDSNDIRNTKGAAIFVAGMDTVKIRGNYIYNGGYSDIQTDLNCNSGNPYTAMDITDNIIPSIGTPNPTLVAVIQDNCIQGLTSYTGGAAIRMRNSHGTMRPGYVTNNKILDPIGGRTLSNLIYNNVTGNNVSGNTLAGCVANIPPTARAGVDISTLETFALLDGSLSSDPDGSISTYSWQQLSGPTGATISTPSGSMTTISNLVVGTYTFRLTVTDNLGAVSSDDIDVVISAVPANIKTRLDLKKRIEN